MSFYTIMESITLSMLCFTPSLRKFRLYIVDFDSVSKYRFNMEEYEDSIRNYKLGLNECLKILGIDHPMTGQMYLDIANVFLKMEKREEAIRFLEKAFEIFDTAKHEESLEKASLANQIALILYEFGSFKESINFANKSNEIYEFKQKTDNRYLSAVLDNKVVIAKASENLDMDEKSLDECEKTFNLVTRRSNWTPVFGKYIVEILKVTFQVLVKSLTHTKKCNIYYIMDLISVSFTKSDPSKDLVFMQELKDKCELHKNCTNFVRSLILTIES